jgi:hypothetical protein
MLALRAARLDIPPANSMFDPQCRPAPKGQLPFPSRGKREATSSAPCGTLGRMGFQSCISGVVGEVRWRSVSTRNASPGFTSRRRSRTRLYERWLPGQTNLGFAFGRPLGGTDHRRIGRRSQRNRDLFSGRSEVGFPKAVIPRRRTALGC